MEGSLDFSRIRPARPLEIEKYCSVQFDVKLNGWKNVLAKSNGCHVDLVSDYMVYTTAFLFVEQMHASRIDSQQRQ